MNERVTFTRTNGRMWCPWSNLEDALADCCDTVRKAHKVGQDISEWRVEAKPDPQPLTREEQIEVAARLAYDYLLNVPGSMDVRMDLFRALRGNEAKPEPAQPTEAEMRRIVMEAGWEVGTCCWWAPGNSAAVRTLGEAYARVMREKADA